MGWTHQRDSRFFSLNQQHFFTTTSGRSYAFTRKGFLGRTLKFESIVHFTPKKWQEAIDRGLGSHATSILTRTRAHLGSYISIVEQAHNEIPLAPDAQKEKCILIKMVQEKLKQLEQEERDVDPANILNGPLQEQLFKAKIQKILFNLRKNLVDIDRKFGSAMLGDADQIVAQAIDAIHQFNWPFEINSTTIIEKNTRRRKITVSDQLHSDEDCAYLAKYEFPEGLDKAERDRLLNALRFNDPDLKNSTREFLSTHSILGQSRGVLIRLLQMLLTPLALILSPFIAIIDWALAATEKPFGEKKGPFNLFIDFIKSSAIGETLKILFYEPYMMLPSLFKPFEKTNLAHKSRTQKLIDEAQAKYHAKLIAFNFSQNEDPFLLAKKAANGNDQLEKRILYQLHFNHVLPRATQDYHQKLASQLAPVYSIEDIINPMSKPLLIPTSAQGELFARFGMFGNVYNILDPLFRGIEEEGRRNPVRGSISMLLWGIPATNLLIGATIVATQAQGALGLVLMETLKLISQIPGLTPNLQSIVSGPLGITSTPDTVGSIISKIVASNPSVEAHHHKESSIAKLVMLLSLAEGHIQKKWNEFNQKSIQEFNALHQLLKKNDRPYLNKEDTRALINLIPKQTDSLDFEQFLFDRYPNVVNAYGDQKAEDYLWNDGLLHVLQESYLDEILQLRRSNPNAWDILKQHKQLTQRLTNHTVEKISKMINIPEQPSRSWFSTIFFTPFRAIHGLVGGILVGLPAYAYYSLTKKPLPAQFRHYSGFNNLMGLIEGLPHLGTILTRTLNSTNEMFMQAKARIYDNATNRPKNLKGVPGFILSVLVSIPLIGIDALISIPSLLWNGVAAVGRYFLGKKQRLTYKDYLYKLPLIGFFAEAFMEPSFEERATRRIIQTNQDKQEIFGIARSITTARAGDISSYRKSHNIPSLLINQMQSANAHVTLGELFNAYDEYKKQKSIFSSESYIMARIGMFAKTKLESGHKARTRIQTSELLQFLFPEEYDELEKQFRIKHAKEYFEGENDGNLDKLRKNSIYTSLISLFKDELKASVGSKTYDVLNKCSTRKLFEAFSHLNNQASTEEITPPLSYQELFHPQQSSQQKDPHLGGPPYQ